MLFRSKLEFELFMPSIAFGAQSDLCRTGFLGKVFVEFSTDQGGNWTQLAVYDPGYYRSDQFQLNSLEIPPEGLTSATRFRFEQKFFEAPIDNWALDNVRVLRLLPHDWRQTSAFKENVHQSQSLIQRAQCCLDTDWCEKRFTAEETQQNCPAFFWYKGEKYLIRLSEILLCFACLLNVLKFIYVSGQDYYLKSRFPFQDEVLEIMSLGTVEGWIKKVPLRYRPRKIIPDEYTAAIHRSARMEEELRKQVADEEGEGEMLVKQEVIERERHTAQKKIKKAQRKLEARKKGKNFKASSVEATLQENLQEDSKIDDLKLHAPVLEGGFNNLEGGQQFAIADSLTTDLDKFQRQNHAMLRVPFRVEDSPTWRMTFAACSILVFTVLFLFELSYVRPYTIHEPVKPYGALEGDIILNSTAMVIFAAYCDIKEIFHVL